LTAPWSFSHVTVTATSTDSLADGIITLVALGTMDHVSVTATGAGGAVALSVGAGPGLNIKDSVIAATGAGLIVGIQPSNSTVQVMTSVVNAGAGGADIDAHGTGSVKAYGSILRGGNLKTNGGKVQIAATEVASGVVLNNAAITCVASFNDQGVAVNPATCN
jgi:hypothetical protein